jgi:radical SAM superfamily enzyme YgiQ (UPF0313 family)
VAAVLEHSGHVTRVFQQIKESDQELVNRVREFEPGFIGFTSMTHNYHHARSLALAMKQALGDIPTMLGGDHCLGKPGYALFDAFDFIMRGEGERSAILLARYLEAGAVDFQAIPGICYLHDGQIVDTGPAELIENLDLLPFPKRSDLPMDQYGQVVLAPPPPSQQRLATVHTSRGCRFNCTFCVTPVAWGKKWRAMSALRVLDELEMLVRQYGINFVCFNDEDPFGNPHRMAQIAHGILERGLDLKWRSFLNPLDVLKHEDIIKMMRDSGYSAALVGVESFRDEILASIKRPVKSNSVSAACRILGDLGISVRTTYIIGYPEDSEASIRDDLARLMDLPCQEVYLSILTAFPGTPLYQKCMDGDLFLTRDTTRMDCQNVTLKTGVSAETLLSMRQKFLRDFYYDQVRFRGAHKRFAERPDLRMVYEEVYAKLFPDSGFVNH